ncbi:hypothetical protein U9M48_016326 [Paspalum notatum var. saurae]|uniref:Uncharacterized protein n=1 Tax=Paspalum notatum var. saurae TaxID=547442 RepID=A0AAQ3T6B9_PASNO
MEKVPRPEERPRSMRGQPSDEFEAIAYRNTGMTAPPSSGTVKSSHHHLTISSYAVVGEGSHICISVEGIGAYCLDTVNHTWSKAGGWTLPFHGKVEYVPELKLWFGLSADAQHLVAADLSAMDSQPQVVGTWKELHLPEEWKQHRKCQVVNLGSGRFCIARFMLTPTKDGLFGQEFVVLTGVEVIPRFHNDNETGGNGKLELKMIPHKSRCHMPVDNTRIEEIPAITFNLSPTTCHVAYHAGHLYTCGGGTHMCKVKFYQAQPSPAPAPLASPPFVSRSHHTSCLHAGAGRLRHAAHTQNVVGRWRPPQRSIAHAIERKRCGGGARRGECGDECPSGRPAATHVTDGRTAAVAADAVLLVAADVSASSSPTLSIYLPLLAAAAPRQVFVGPFARDRRAPPTGGAQLTMGLSRRFLNLIVASRMPGVKSLRRIDMARQLFCSDTQQSRVKIERIRLPKPTFSFRASASDQRDQWKMDCFPFVDCKVICADQSGRAFLFEADTRHVKNYANT